MDFFCLFVVVLFLFYAMQAVCNISQYCTVKKLYNLKRLPMMNHIKTMAMDADQRMIPHHLLDHNQNTAMNP